MGKDPDVPQAPGGRIRALGLRAHGGAGAQRASRSGTGPAHPGSTPLSPAEQDRLRRRDSLPVLPDSYEPLLRAAGLKRTLAFIRHYGGGEARFPARPGPDHPMVRLLGRRVVEAMRADYGALDLHWPAASDYLALVDARALRQKGWSVRDIARRLYRDPKTIERYLKGVRVKGVRRRRAVEKPAPLPLFMWGG